MKVDEPRKIVAQERKKHKEKMEKLKKENEYENRRLL